MTADPRDSGTEGPHEGPPDAGADAASGEALVDPALHADDGAIEAALRPKHLAEFVGQVRVREQLGLVLVGSARQGSRARPRAAIWAARVRQDHARHDHRCRVGSAAPHHQWSGDSARG